MQGASSCFVLQTVGGGVLVLPPHYIVHMQSTSRLLWSRCARRRTKGGNPPSRGGLVNLQAPDVRHQRTSFSPTALIPDNFPFSFPFPSWLAPGTVVPSLGSGGSATMLHPHGKGDSKSCDMHYIISRAFVVRLLSAKATTSCTPAPTCSAMSRCSQAQAQAQAWAQPREIIILHDSSPATATVCISAAVFLAVGGDEKDEMR
ncbi:hypothetical protein CGRA01v4_08019 [Colletotrichum graminicola]|nr:hypothetical protein CGRA01v4_08019 [Colletotrichum graminicola]